MTDLATSQREFEEWRDTLRASCGNFDVTPGNDLTARHGSFGIRPMGGLELAQVSTNYTGVMRDEACIRRDDIDCLYLVHQISGRMGIEHCGHEIWIEPGDCVLLDASRAMGGHYGRDGVGFATLHIPRELFFREDSDHSEIELGVPRRMSGYRGGSLNAALKHIRENGLSAEAGQGFLIDLARLAFRGDPRRHSLSRFGHEIDRIEALKEMIGRHATDPDFSLSDLAFLAGMSERQVQRSLQVEGTSFSRERLEVRLRRVKTQLTTAARNGTSISVTQAAYEAGFNDLSHFNRVFRRRFGCTPRDMVRTKIDPQDIG